MLIRVVATPTAKADDGSSEWKVAVYVDRVKRQTGLVVRDPLTREQRSLCRWYLDKFRQREPCSTSKAKKAASLLEDYGCELLRQLHLADTVPSKGDVLICIEDASGLATQSGYTVHQLYWEFLEDPKLWNDGVQVTVQRTVQQDDYNHYTNAKASSGRQVSLLLVTARDLSRKWTCDPDINPSLVSDILWKMQSTLSGTDSATELSIDIVRPGTFEALESKLHRTAKGTAEPFDIIHFDLHGTLKRRKDEASTGFLRFSDPGSDETIPVPADKVAKLVSQHQIPSVIFNACDSANPSHGDEANIAKVFVQRGTHQVLAMAHTASENATSSFLEAFYSKFLVGGCGFVKAARHARSILRSDPLRSARFHMRVPVMDWIVPVTYCSDGQQDSFAIPSVSARELRSSTRYTIEAVSLYPQHIYGRDFDCLRLEKLLLRDGLAYVYGAPGVGKTAFLRQLASSWTRSNFITHSILISFASRNTTSVAHVVQEAMRQLEEPIDSDLATESLVRALLKKRTVLILDDFVHFNGRGAKGTERLWADFRAFIKTMRDVLLPAEDGETATYILLSGWTESATEIKSLNLCEMSSYKLQGLSKADSMSILQSLGPSSSVARNEGDHDDHTELLKAESFIHLLQGNPTGLIHFGRLALRSNLSYSAMYTILHSEDPIICLDVNSLRQDFPLLKEFMSLLSLLSDGCLATWTALAWYWHCGPLASDFATMLMDARIIAGKDVATDALEKARRLGFIQQDADERVVWIHSLFTIFIRIAKITGQKSANTPLIHTTRLITI